MITEINNYLTGQLRALGYIQQVLGMAEIIDLGDSNSAPAVVIDGIPQHIQLADYKSVCFLISDDKVRETRIPNDFGGRDAVRQRYNFELVLYVNGLDDKQCATGNVQEIAVNIGKQLKLNNKVFRNQYNLYKAEVEITDYEFNRYDVFRSLYGKEIKLLDTDNLCIISFEVTLEGEERCFLTNPCNCVNAYAIGEAVIGFTQNVAGGDKWDIYYNPLQPVTASGNLVEMQWLWQFYSGGSFVNYATGNSTSAITELAVSNGAGTYNLSLTLKYDDGAEMAVSHFVQVDNAGNIIRQLEMSLLPFAAIEACENIILEANINETNTTGNLFWSRSDDGASFVQFATGSTCTPNLNVLPVAIFLAYTFDLATEWTDFDPAFITNNTSPYAGAGVYTVIY